MERHCAYMLMTDIFGVFCVFLCVCLHVWLCSGAFALTSGATWDLQPEKLDFSQFHRKPYRGTPKHLPHIDREGWAHTHSCSFTFTSNYSLEINCWEKHNAIKTCHVVFRLINFIDFSLKLIEIDPLFLTSVPLLGWWRASLMMMMALTWLTWRSFFLV